MSQRNTGWALWAAVLGLAPMAAAQVTNGDFSAGLDGWNAHGSVTAAQDPQTDNFFALFQEPGAVTGDN